ncbi:MAG TPA: zinc ABC transporter substrate-binding protein [candidate division Zixibacteria bacterium]|nr:zinc ABC transporter substrate-binding protein [candidate division Zixibacteria bacterium]
MKNAFIFFILCLLIIMAVAGCGDKKKAEALEMAQAMEDDVYSVFVSISPLLSIADSIAGGRAVVQVLVPPGENPLEYESPPADVAKLANSAVLFYVGMGFDDWAAQAALDAEDGPRIYDVSGIVPKLPALPDEPLRRLREKDLMPATGNPYVWLDPNIVADIIVPLMARALASADPPNSDFYMANAKRLQGRLKTLAEEARERLEPHASKPVVLHHGAFAYFCRRYKIPAMDAIVPFVAIEPTDEDLAEIVEFSRKSGAVAILSERGIAPETADFVAQSLGIPLIEVDPFGTGDEDYFELIHRNVNSIALGLE